MLVYSFGIMPLNRLVNFISEISYELYLVHILIFKVIFTLIEVDGKLEYVIGLFAIGTAVFVAYIYHVIISFVMARKYPGSDPISKK
jgi:peptidoglycan/LPS O-acetylase OafA/YrhL